MGQISRSRSKRKSQEIIIVTLEDLFCTVQFAQQVYVTTCERDAFFGCGCICLRTAYHLWKLGNPRAMCSICNWITFLFGECNLTRECCWHWIHVFIWAVTRGMFQLWCCANYFLHTFDKSIDLPGNLVFLLTGNTQMKSFDSWTKEWILYVSDKQGTAQKPASVMMCGTRGNMCWHADDFIF